MTYLDDRGEQLNGAHRYTLGWIRHRRCRRSGH